MNLYFSTVKNIIISKFDYLIVLKIYNYIKESLNKGFESNMENILNDIHDVIISLSIELTESTDEDRLNQLNILFKNFIDLYIEHQEYNRKESIQSDIIDTIFNEILTDMKYIDLYIYVFDKLTLIEKSLYIYN